MFQARFTSKIEAFAWLNSNGLAHTHRIYLRGKRFYAYPAGLAPSNFTQVYSFI